MCNGSEVGGPNESGNLRDCGVELQVGREGKSMDAGSSLIQWY